MKATNEEFYRDKSVLVTGSSGFLATNLVAALKDTRCHIRRLSRHGSHVMPVSGTSRVEDMFGDVASEEIWRNALESIDIVFHFAAQTNVYVANEAPSADLNANVLPILHMLETCRKADLHPAVLFSGTVTEAGISTRIPVDETHPDSPVTVYDLHKLMAENYLKYYVRQDIVQGAVLRLSNVYGPGPRSSGADRGVLNNMIRKALSGETLTIYGHGNYVRDYVYVGDVIGAFLAAGAGMELLSGHHYVIGSGRGDTVAEAVNMVARHVEAKFGHPVSVAHIDSPLALSPIEERDFIADTGKFSRDTGWTAATSLEKGIDLTIDYFSSEIRVVS